MSLSLPPDLLAPVASGTRRMQGTTESATTDAFGVVRAGAYGTKLSSTYEPLRGDASRGAVRKPCSRRMPSCLRVRDSQSTSAGSRAPSRVDETLPPKRESRLQRCEPTRPDGIG